MPRTELVCKANTPRRSAYDCDDSLACLDNEISSHHNVFKLVKAMRAMLGPIDERFVRRDLFANGRARAFFIETYRVYQADTDRGRGAASLS